MIVDAVFALFDVLAWSLLIALASGWWKLRRILIDIHAEVGLARGGRARRGGGTGGLRPSSEGEIGPPP